MGREVAANATITLAYLLSSSSGGPSGGVIVHALLLLSSLWYSRASSSEGLGMTGDLGDLGMVSCKKNKIKYFS